MIIIFDFEVFKYDTLLGAYLVDENNNIVSLFQSWDLNEIKEFWETYKHDLWVGWNNWFYDNLILEAIIKGQDPYLMSKNIINAKYKPWGNLPIISYDLMNCRQKKLSLKLTELIAGKNIHTSEVDFNIDRPLTIEEKQLTDGYNRSDLDQTLYNFNKFYSDLELRLEIIKEFNLPVIQGLKATEAKIAAMALDNAQKIEGIEYQLIKPTMYSTLQLKNQELINFYLNEDFRKGIIKTINICNAELNIGAGGLHSSLKKVYFDKILYVDVSGYYNLVMINYDLLPRSVSEKGKQLYEMMYHEQLRLKKIDPRKRKVYKTILLAVFGAMNNPGCDFYDPQKALLVTITGQLFMADLLEKLDEANLGVTVVQTNTDGIFLGLEDWNNEQKVINIIESWEKRTGFTAKKEHIEKLFQRDVNCYLCLEDNEVTFKGEAVKNYDISDKGYSNRDIFDSKEPPIIAQGIINCLLKDITPEDMVNNNKENLRLFQYPCKKNTFDYTQYEIYDKLGNIVGCTKLQGIDRAFAYKNNDYIGMVYKYKNDKGKLKKAKVANLPDSIFICNCDINNHDTYEAIKDIIDYDYYVKRIYERLNEFIAE